MPEITRRQMLVRSARLALAATMTGFPARLLAGTAAIATLDVAYAGSMGSLMEGPIKAAAARTLQLELRGRAAGSNALAQLIVGGSIRPDVFISVTPGPMQIVLKGAKAESALPFAHTEMVIAYSPKSRFATRFAEAARVENSIRAAMGEGPPSASHRSIGTQYKGNPTWWELLEEPGLRFGRTDPVTDPQGRNIIFTMMLAEKLLAQPGLAEKILGPAINPRQIFTEPTVMARLQSGELDAASAYKIQPGPFHLPYVVLRDEFNLSEEDIQRKHPEIKLAIGGKTWVPEPLVYYAAALKDAPNPRGAAAFVGWLSSPEVRGILHSFDYDVVEQPMKLPREVGRPSEASISKEPHA